MKDLFKQIIPPVFFKIYRLVAGLNSPNRKVLTGTTEIWKGDYSSWKEAIQKSVGYNDKSILEKCRAALLKVKNGEAVYERDSVIFDEIQYSWPLLACLENIAINNNNQLHILDFGGSLGTTYFQNKHFLQQLSSFKWIIIEQQHFVEAGIKDFQNDFLKFRNSVEEAFHLDDINCMLLSSVLQYLPDPYQLVSEFMKYEPEYILIDRTGFVDGNQTLLTVQNVPEEIYKASYPCWFFNEDIFLKSFADKYEVIADFNDSFTFPVIVNERKCYWKGFYLKKK